MARIRSVHPGLFTDESFMEATANPLACVFLIGLWGQADDKGAFDWKPMSLKARILPATSADGVEILEYLISLGFIAKYEVGGKSYGAIRNFGKFQRPKKPNSLYPMPHEWRIYAATNDSSSETEDDDDGSGSEPTADLDKDVSPPVPHQFPTSSEIEKQMEDGGGSKKEEERKKERTPTPPRQAAAASGRRGACEEAGFERFWQAYPRKVGKGVARSAWSKAVKRTDPDSIISAVIRQKFDDRERFIPHPSTWLNGERWLDEAKTGDPVLRAVGLNDDGTLMNSEPDPAWSLLQ
jgi:hypothetical protein